MLISIAIKKSILFVLILITICGLSPFVFSAENEHLNYSNNVEGSLVVGIFPRRNKKLSEKIFTPLAKYLEKKINRKIILKIPSSFLEFWQGVEKQNYDLVHFNQYHYVVSNKKYGYKVILRNKEFGSATITGVILVRNDSGINSIADLKNKNIVFGGGPRAMQSYLYARYLLEQENLNKGSYNQDFAVNPPNAIFTLYYGKADAVGVGDKVMQLDMVNKNIDMSQIKVLSQGKQLPQLPWAVGETMDPKLIETLTKLMSSMHENAEGKQVLKAAKLDSFVATKDSDYDEHRKIIQSVLNEVY